MLLLMSTVKSSLKRFCFSTKAREALSYKKNNIYFKNVKTRNKSFRKPRLRQKPHSSNRLPFRQLLKKFVYKKKKRRKLGWYKNKKPYWRQKFYLRTRRYSNFVLPLASHIRGITPGEIRLNNINERHLWTYNVKYRRARFVFRNKIYMRKTFLRLYGFKNVFQLRAYNLKIRKSQRPLASGFQVLEGRFSRIVVRLGWFRSSKLVAMVIKRGGFFVNGGVFKNPNTRVALNDVLFIRKKNFTRAVTSAKKLKRLQRYKPTVFKAYSPSSRYWQMHLNTIYRLKFQKIKKFRLLRLKARRRKLAGRRVFKIISCSTWNFLRKRIRYYKLAHLALCLCEDNKKRVAFLPIRFFIVSRNQNAIMSFFSAFARIHYWRNTGLSSMLVRLAINSPVLSADRLYFARSVDFVYRYPLATISYFRNRASLSFSHNFISRWLIPHYLKKKKIEKRKLIKKHKLIVERNKRKKRAKLLSAKKGYRRPYRRRLRGRRRGKRGFRFKRQRFTYYKRRVPWRSVKVALQYIGLRRNKLLHPLPASVFFKSIFVLYNEFFLKKLTYNSKSALFKKRLFFKKKFFFRRFRRFTNSRAFKLLSGKRKKISKLLFARGAYYLFKRHITSNFKKKFMTRPSNKQFEFSKNKACFVLVRKFKFSSFAWLKSANLIQLNRRVFDVFSNQKLY